MTIWTCATCAIEHADTDEPPARCEICSDERQFVPADGQRWTTRETLEAEGFRIVVSELEPGLHAVTTTPALGIGQRGLLVQTEGGNLLFEPPGFIDGAGVAAVSALGGVAVIASSHPHLTGSSIQWSHAFDGAPVLVAAEDERWIRRPDPVVALWSDRVELLHGLLMIQAGGHFAGSSVVHWAHGADGRGVLLTGDTIAVGGDRRSANVMRSFVNNIPLPERAVRRIQATARGLSFDRLYSAFGELPADASGIVEWSLERYVGWLRGDFPE
ncbi:hydrolase [Curtobacterium sp. MCBA15_001]|uniref:hydrolase n=1 Tax=Curtobacterium sp. MCBA15_001 TaxID=1898731 RepID=UPI0008DE5185|nr:hydrolase [Curtobacterium sp. MCBA15_001]OIH92524.1 hydrolase [Curtobacterium sp. MCBA15_001]